MAKKKNQIITVSGSDVSITTIKDEEYISLTDIDAAFDGKGPHIENCMRNRNTVESLGVWESVHSPDFNSVGLDGIFPQTGLNSVMIERGTPKEKRFDLLSQTAISQYKRLIEHKDLGLLGEGGEG